MKHWSAARSITSTIVARPCALAVMSEKNHFIRTLLVVAQRERNGIADIFQFARLGFSKLDAGA